MRKVTNTQKTLKRLVKLQSHIACPATGNVKPPISGNVQPPVSHPQHSSSAPAHAVLPVKKQANREKNDRSATVLGNLNPRSMVQWETVAPNRACGL